MRWTLILLLFAADPEVFSDAATEQEQISDSEGIQKCEDNIKGLKNEVLGLEYFLQDKKHYKKYCPSLKWAQPSLDTYKKDPKSYLPSDCPKEIINE